MFEKELDKYTIKGHFTFQPLEVFKTKCNAPTEQSGIYLIYKVINLAETLVYIGSSGQKDKEGNKRFGRSFAESLFIFFP